MQEGYISVMYNRSLFPSLQITRADIGLQVNWAVNLLIADNHFEPSSRIFSSPGTNVLGELMPYPRRRRCRHRRRQFQVKVSVY